VYASGRDFVIISGSLHFRECEDFEAGGLKLDSVMG
jgi:hypothetical protein